MNYATRSTADAVRAFVPLANEISSDEHLPVGQVLLAVVAADAVAPAGEGAS